MAPAAVPMLMCGMCCWSVLVKPVGSLGEEQQQLICSSYKATRQRMTFANSDDMLMPHANSGPERWPELDLSASIVDANC